MILAPSVQKPTKLIIQAIGKKKATNNQTITQ